MECPDFPARKQQFEETMFKHHQAHEIWAFDDHIWLLDDSRIIKTSTNFSHRLLATIWDGSTISLVLGTPSVLLRSGFTTISSSRNASLQSLDLLPFRNAKHQTNHLLWDLGLLPFLAARTAPTSLLWGCLFLAIESNTPISTLTSYRNINTCLLLFVAIFASTNLSWLTGKVNVLKPFLELWMCWKLLL